MWLLKQVNTFIENCVNNIKLNNFFFFCKLELLENKKKGKTWNPIYLWLTFFFLFFLLFNRCVFAVSEASLTAIVKNKWLEGSQSTAETEQPLRVRHASALLDKENLPWRGPMAHCKHRTRSFDLKPGRRRLPYPLGPKKRISEDGKAGFPSSVVGGSGLVSERERGRGRASLCTVRY